METDGQKPSDMLGLPAPRVIYAPALLDRCLHSSSLLNVTVLCCLRPREHTAQEQRHVEAAVHQDPPM